MFPRRFVAPILFVLLLARSALAAEVRVHEGTNLAADANPVDGRIVIELLDGLWRVSARGGDAERLTPLSVAASKPRWSPDGQQILYEQKGAGLYIMSADGETTQAVSDEPSEQLADWHPAGKRIVFSSPGPGTGLDLYERDLATGLRWRLTSHSGDETGAAWSADGRHLSYVRREAGRWFLMLKPFGQPPRVLEASENPIYAPAWRPDGTLLTYLATDDQGMLEMRMTILSEPPLTRTLVRNEDLFQSPVSWIDRQRMLYTSDGAIKTRGFEDRHSKILPFSAAVGTPPVRGELRTRGRLRNNDRARNELIVRASRLFDGVSAGYQYDVDVHIRNGRIVDIGDISQSSNVPVIDIGNVTVMPGLIDVYAMLPDALTPALATELLASGVTTIVAPRRSGQSQSWPESIAAPRLLQALPADSANTDAANVGLVRLDASGRSQRRIRGALNNWRRRGVPLLATNWRSGLAAGADLTLGSAELPTSPRGRRYEDLQTLMQGGPLTLVSALADANTPGLSDLLPAASTVPVRHAQPPVLANGETRIVVGSLPSGLPPGTATLAELLALHAAGLEPAAVMAAATGNAAGALGLGGQLGQITVGARADLLLVAGDPLNRPVDTAAVVAVLLDGNFLSIAGLRDTLGDVE